MQEIPKKVLKGRHERQERTKWISVINPTEAQIQELLPECVGINIYEHVHEGQTFLIGAIEINLLDYEVIEYIIEREDIKCVRK